MSMSHVRKSGGLDLFSFFFLSFGLVYTLVMVHFFKHQEIITFTVNFANCFHGQRASSAAKYKVTFEL